MNQKLSLSFLSFALCSLIPFFSFSQISEAWVSVYNGPLNSSDYSNAMAIDALGNVYVTGSIRPLGAPFDQATIKYNSAGVQQWLAIYNGGAGTFSNGVSIAVDGSGNVYVTGPSVGTGTTYDYATTKYDSLGVQQWATRYNGPANTADHSISIAIDGSGNVYVTGFSKGIGSDYDYATIKYNSSGVEQWVSRYNGSGNAEDRPASIGVDNMGNVYVTGYSTGSSLNTDYVTIKYNSAGIQQWIKIYNGPGNDVDQATAMKVDGAGNVYITGLSDGIATSFDYATIKYNSAGTQQWLTRYNHANSFDQAAAITIDGLGNVYVAGKSHGGVTTEFDYATIKYNSLGAQQWVSRYNGPADAWDMPSSIALDGSGNVYVTGRSDDDTTYYDYATLKYNSSGVEQWLQRHGGSDNDWDQANTVLVDVSGNVYVTGYTTGIGTNYDFTTIKYSIQVGINDLAPNDSPLFYPNPSSDFISIDTKNEKLGSNYLITNSVGQHILSGKLTSKKTTVDISNLPVGMYLLNIGDATRQNFKLIKN